MALHHLLGYFLLSLPLLGMFGFAYHVEGRDGLKIVGFSLLVTAIVVACAFGGCRLLGLE